MKSRKKSKSRKVTKPGYTHIEMAPIERAKSGWFYYESFFGDGVLFYRNRDGTGEIFVNNQWEMFAQCTWSVESSLDLYLGRL